MIRASEMVLPGHPDKFCDQIADALVAEAAKLDPDAYAQIEAGVWSDVVWLSGAIAARAPLARSLRDVVVETGRAIGYRDGNWIDAARYAVNSTVCLSQADPRQWSGHVNDQSIVIGWAGYDARTRYLPPEHFLCHHFRDAVAGACADGLLRGHGPDGKILVRLREEGSAWILEHVLITLQQAADVSLMEVSSLAARTLEAAYERACAHDDRWRAPWREVTLLINPNGPLLNGGSDGDNGQTGRKLAVDFYGPRIPIGGGALSGKHISHIDRIGAYAARSAAVRAVRSGAQSCLVRVCYAPNLPVPLDVSIEMAGRGERPEAEDFAHDLLAARYPAGLISREIGQGLHFYDAALPWNQGL